MKSYVKAINNLPFILRLIFALPVVDGIVYGIYRICKGKVLIGVLWIFFGAAILWIVDLLSIIFCKKIVFLV